MERHKPCKKRLSKNHTYLVDMSILLPDSEAATKASKLEKDWGRIIKEISRVEKR